MRWWRRRRPVAPGGYVGCDSRDSIPFRLQVGEYVLPAPGPNGGRFPSSPPSDGPR